MADPDAAPALAPGLGRPHRTRFQSLGWNAAIRVVRLGFTPVEVESPAKAPGRSIFLEFDTHLRFYTIAEGVLHLRHLGHEVGDLDQFVFRVSSGDNDVGHLGLAV